MSILNLKDINKSFSDGEMQLSVLKNLSLTIDSNEIVVIMGPSGSGKTTLLNLISMVEKLDAGTIKFGDTIQDFNDLKSKDEIRICLVV